MMDNTPLTAAKYTHNPVIQFLNQGKYHFLKLDRFLLENTFPGEKIVEAFDYYYRQEKASDFEKILPYISRHHLVDRGILSLFASNGNTRILDILRKQFKKKEHLEEAMVQSIHKKQTEAFRFLKQARGEAPGKWEYLEIAVKSQHVEILNDLVPWCDPTEHEMAILDIAISTRNKEIVEYFLNFCDPSARKSRPLSLAIALNLSDIAKILWDKSDVILAEQELKKEIRPSQLLNIQKTIDELISWDQVRTLQQSTSAILHQGSGKRL